MSMLLIRVTACLLNAKYFLSKGMFWLQPSAINKWVQKYLRQWFTYIISDTQVYDPVMADVMKEIAKKRKEKKRKDKICQHYRYNCYMHDLFIPLRICRMFYNVILTKYIFNFNVAFSYLTLKLKCMNVEKTGGERKRNRLVCTLLVSYVTYKFQKWSNILLVYMKEVIKDYVVTFLQVDQR